MERSLYLPVRPSDLGRDKIIPAFQCAAIWQRQQLFIHCGNSANAQSACGLNQTRFSKGVCVVRCCHGWKSARRNT